MMTLMDRIAGSTFQNMIYLKLPEICSVRSLVWALQMALVRPPTVCAVPSVNEHKYKEHLLKEKQCQILLRHTYGFL